MSDRISYPDKTNNASDPETIKKFFATEANEVKIVANSHADDIEALQAKLPPTSKFYGFFTSLSVLEAAYPVGEENAYAIIQINDSTSPQIALWNNTGSTWEISGATTDRVYVANEAALPTTGDTNKWYITLDENKLWFYNDSQWQLISGSGTASNTLVAKYALIPETDGQTVFKVPGEPSAIILIKNGTHLIEGPLLQYNYNNATFEFTLKDGAVKNNDFTDRFEVVALGVGAIKQMTIADTETQTEFNFSGNPGTLLVYANGVYQQTQQYTRTYFNTNNKTVFTKGKPVGTIVEHIKIP